MAKLIKIGVTNCACQQNWSYNNAIVESLTKIKVSATCSMSGSVNTVVEFHGEADEIQ